MEHKKAVTVKKRLTTLPIHFLKGVNANFEGNDFLFLFVLFFLGKHGHLSKLFLSPIPHFLLFNRTILNKVTNLLKFPKSPKVDRILPPLSVASHQQKVEKMAQEYMASLPVLGPPVGAGAVGVISTSGGRSSRHPRKPVKQTRLSPLDVPSVSVN